MARQAHNLVMPCTLWSSNRSGPPGRSHKLLLHASLCTSAEVWARGAAQGVGAARALPPHQHHCGWRHHAGGKSFRFWRLFLCRWECHSATRACAALCSIIPVALFSHTGIAILALALLVSNLTACCLPLTFYRTVFLLPTARLPQNAALVAEAGANALVAGTAVFAGKEPPEVRCLAAAWYANPENSWWTS